MNRICSSSLIVSFVLSVIVVANCRGAAISSSQQTKVFNYHGTNMPIKDDRTGEIIKNNENSSSNDTDLLEPASGGSQAENEAACWTMIVEQSAVTFALQNRVLDELQKDLTNLGQNIDGDSSTVRERAASIANKMRANMREALAALKAESAEEYFDNLFDSSENIIKMSKLIREPKLDEKMFLVLVKAVSRLGRNNSALIQEFTDRCSIIQRAPRPRLAGTSSRV